MDRSTELFFIILISCRLSFFFSVSSTFAPRNIGPHRRRSDRATQQERVRLSNVQCVVRSDRILATAEQGSATRCLAARRQDQHHLHRGDFGGIRSSRQGKRIKAVPWCFLFKSSSMQSVLGLF